MVCDFDTFSGAHLRDCVTGENFRPLYVYSRRQVAIMAMRDWEL